jgi:hypothetical protein
MQSNYNITKYNIFNIFFMACFIYKKKKKGNFGQAVFKRFAIPALDKDFIYLFLYTNILFICLFI